MEISGAAAFHDNEPHHEDIAQRLNWLRAGVLGANDGIVSVAAIVVGVAGVTTDSGPILIAGAAGVVGGAISMALGEYVSVSSQKDSQQRLDRERTPRTGRTARGGTCRAGRYLPGEGPQRRNRPQVATELTAHDALAAHLSAELHIDETDIVSPWHAAFASAVAFLIGAILPMLAILLPPQNIRVPLTFAAVLIALAATGGHRRLDRRRLQMKAAVRVVIGGARLSWRRS